LAVWGSRFTKTKVFITRRTSKGTSTKGKCSPGRKKKPCVKEASKSRKKQSEFVGGGGAEKYVKGCWRRFLGGKGGTETDAEEIKGNETWRRQGGMSRRDPREPCVRDFKGSLKGTGQKGGRTNVG